MSNKESEPLISSSSTYVEEELPNYDQSNQLINPSSPTNINTNANKQQTSSSENDPTRETSNHHPRKTDSDPPNDYNDLREGTSYPTNNYDSASIPPPDFSIYRASYTTDSIGNITSHDEHLNSDGEALCRFILLQLSNPPCLFVKITGDHEETRQETITETVDGRVNYRYETRRQTVTDFSFTISLPDEEGLERSNRARKPYMVSDSEVVGRGGHWRECGRWEKGRDLRLLEEFVEGNDRNANDLDRQEEFKFERKSESVKFSKRRKADKISKEIKERGLLPFIPPWMFPRGTFSVEPERPPDSLLRPDWEIKVSDLYHSSVDKHTGHYINCKRTKNDQNDGEVSGRGRESLEIESELRAWCDEYCESRNGLKEFRVKKVVYGWDLRSLERDLMEFLPKIPHLRSTSFRVDFETTSSSITIRPINKLSKIFSLKGFYKFLTIITLIYPILKMIRFIFYGVEFDVFRCCYPIVYVDETDDRGLGGGRSSDGGGTERVVGRTLVGLSQEDWFENNRDKIISACQSNKVGPLS